MADTSGWHEAAKYDIENTILSYSEIATKYGRERSTIVKLKSDHKLTRPPGVRKGNTPLVNLQPIDVAHKNIGMHVTILRGGQSASFMAEALGVSPHILRKMELGVHEITLLQLQKLGVLSDMSLAELMSPYQGRG